jgi:hypothetical protein
MSMRILSPRGASRPICIPIMMCYIASRNPVSIVSRNLRSHDQTYDFHRLITGDEKWVFPESLHDSCLPANRDNVLIIPCHMIQSVKCLLACIMGVSRPILILAVPKQTNDNMPFFVDSVIPDLKRRICEHERREALKGFRINLNCSVAQSSVRSNEVLETKNARKSPFSS